MEDFQNTKNPELLSPGFFILLSLILYSLSLLLSKAFTLQFPAFTLYQAQGGHTAPDKVF